MQQTEIHKTPAIHGKWGCYTCPLVTNIVGFCCVREVCLKIFWKQECQKLLLLMEIWERVVTCHVHKQWAWVWPPVWVVAPGHWTTWAFLLFLLQLFKHSEAIPSKYELEQSWKTMLRSGGKCYCRSGADTLCAYTGLWSLSSTVKLSAQFILFLTIACAHTYRAEYIISVSN